MAGTRMSMRKIREVLRLTHELRLTVRQVREATGVGKTAVSEYVSRAKVIGIMWPIPPEVGDAALELLYLAATGPLATPLPILPRPPSNRTNFDNSDSSSCRRSVVFAWMVASIFCFRSRSFSIDILF